MAETDWRALAENTLDMAADQTLPASDSSRMGLLAMSQVQATLAVADRLDRVIELLEDSPDGERPGTVV